jgi:hypothetical protein
MPVGFPYFKSAPIAEISGITGSDGSFIVHDGNKWIGESGATARASMGVVIGTDVQAQGAVLDDFNTLGANSADNEFLVGTGAGTLAWESGATARTSLGVGTGDSPQFTGLGIGEASPVTDVELTGSSPGFTFHNSTEEDGDEGRESTIHFRGEQSGGEESVLAQIKGCHSGSSDDERGQIIFYTNTGEGGPTEALKIKDDQDIVTQGSITLPSNGEYYVGSNKVVGARVVDARCDDAINSGDATTDGVIDALRDAMIAHGLIEAGAA